MFNWNVFAPARPAAYAFAFALIGALAVAATSTNTVAEEKKAAPKKAPPAKAPPKQDPKQQAQPEAPQLIFSPWTKFCLKGQEANAKQVCFTGKDGRVESGQPVVAAVLIEPDGEPRKILRVTLPLGMSLQPGTRVIIDQGQPMTGPYVICFNNGCMADYEASDALIGTMKKGQGLVVQGINGAGQPISLVLPLNDFAKAYDGPPTDPAVFEKQQKQLQEELQRRAEEARKKLEGGK
jgi:invasion protein IalB